MWLFLFLIAPLFLHSKEILLDTRINYPQLSHFPITPRVNVITGEHLEEEVDLVVAGSQPLSIRRFYSHNGSYHPGYNHWRFNPEQYCVANFSYEKQDRFVAAGEASGTITNYQNGSQNQLFSFSTDKCKGFIHFDQNGQSHPLNAKVAFELTERGSVKGFCWEGTITSGSGAKRKFKSAQKYWISTKTFYEAPGDKESEIYKITPQVWTPYEVPVTEERLPNGNIIEYKHDFFDDRKGFQKYILLTSITAYNSLKTKVLGKITFDHKSQNYRRTGLVITGSDQRESLYKYERLLKINYLAQVKTPNQPEINYRHQEYSTDVQNKIEYINRGSNQFFITKYDKSGRVQKQLAPVGPDNEMVAIALYDYGPNFTKVTDAEGNYTIYRYDANYKILAIEIYEKNALYSIEKYNWDEKTGNLKEKILEDSNGKMAFKEEFKYDTNHNLILETKSDHDGSYTLYSLYSDDGFNLKIRQWDDFGKKIEYTYVPHTNLLKSETIYNGSVICKKTINDYDDAAILIKSEIDDGSGFIKSIEIEPKYSLPCFGLPETVSEKVNNHLVSKIVYSYTSFGKVATESHYDNKGEFCYQIVNDYDDRERLKWTKDALGNTTVFKYDEYNNLKSQLGPKADYFKEWDYDSACRPILEKIEGLTSQMSYDKLGRLASIKDESGFETKYKYDALGRVVETIHPDASTKKKTYDL